MYRGSLDQPPALRAKPSMPMDWACWISRW